MPQSLGPPKNSMQFACSAIAIGIWQQSRKQNVLAAVSNDRRQSDPKLKQVAPCPTPL